MTRADDTHQTVIVVDDDPLVREGLDNLLRSVGLSVTLFASADEALECALPPGDCCYIIDVRMPKIGGLDLQASLLKRGDRRPVIFMTGHGDIPMSVRAMKAGADDFLIKPVRDQDLLDAVAAALARARTGRLEMAHVDEARHRYSSLTSREREVMQGVVQGLMNKQIAGNLGLSEITVKLHRANLMRKMALTTIADLVRTGELLGTDSTQA
ncbi:response regulator transcription factor [Brevundimonas sp.]|uniref:response regulator transcription factor n=1 Tax=Brevundimonas sp. TaxID=1871086 RepID=UPI0028A206C7|nr:response regulator [Brevundimonas sp.]